MIIGLTAGVGLVWVSGLGGDEDNDLDEDDDDDDKDGDVVNADGDDTTWWLSTFNKNHHVYVNQSRIRGV